MKHLLGLMFVLLMVGCSSGINQATFPDDPSPLPEGGPALTEPPAAPPPSRD